MPRHEVVSRQGWLKARKAHLAKEKELTRLRDRLSRERRELPWVRVEKEYLFEGPDGRRSLAELFEGRSQLIVYHFMFASEWEEGCKSCSLLADNYEPSVVHLRERDVALVTVSSAPLEKLEAFKKRMGWSFKWFSTVGDDFNRDYHVTFTPEEIEHEVDYNYEMRRFPVVEAPGISVFAKDEDGGVFHTYSSYARGLDNLIGTYHLLDLVPKGRDEEGLAYGMEWLRHHDRYGA